jgi:ATP-binding cassette subfamily B protein
MERNLKKQSHTAYPNVSFLDVMKAFWGGVRKHKFFSFAFVGCTVFAAFIDLITPFFYKKFFDLLTKGSQYPHVVQLLVATLFSIFLFKSLAWIGYRSATFLTNRAQSGIILELRSQAFDYLIEHSYSFFTNNFTGSLVQRVNRFARAYEQLSDKFVWNFIPLFIKIIGVITILSFVNKTIALILGIWAVIFVVFNYYFAIWKLKYDTERAATDSQTTAVLSDAVSNHNTIQLFTHSSEESEKFRAALGRQAKLTKFVWDLESVVEAIQSATIIVVELFLFYYAVKYWQRGLLTVGTFVLIQTYLFALIDQLWNFSRFVRDAYSAFADAKEMVEIMKLPHEINDAPSATKLIVPHGEVLFKNTTFYFNESRKVLDTINLTINGGEKVALIGPSGAGKSTFVRLLLRLYEVNSGEILIDGQNISNVTQESLRKNISLVPQDPILFHRTLMENIRYGRSDATDAEVIEAAHLAHCDEFIDQLPLGYLTLVGERGIKLSGGERQRVAIARAILKKAPILILDEATSSLDSHSEALIQDALNTLMKNCTTIVIAHRLSTIRMMDRIVVLDGGKVLEQGSHDELLEQENSLYKRLWTLQAGGFLKEENGVETDGEENPVVSKN